MYEQKVCKNCDTAIPIDIPMHMRKDMCFCTLHCRYLFFREKKPIIERSTYSRLSDLFFN